MLILPVRSGTHSSVKADLHVTGEVSEEGRHSLSLNVSLSGGIKVIKSILEVLINVILRSFSFESQMGVENLETGGNGILGLEDELTERLAVIGSLLTGILLVHRPHELVTAGTLDVELLRNGSRIFAKMFDRFIIFIPAGWETWMRMVLVPLGCDTTEVRADLDGGDCAKKGNKTNGFHYFINKNVMTP